MTPGVVRALQSFAANFAPAPIAEAQPQPSTKEQDTVADTASTTDKPKADISEILKMTLTGLVVALTAVHNAGVKLGHFGSTDFISIADSLALSALTSMLPAPQAAA